MNAYEAFVLYTGLKVAFQRENYDYFKFEGKLKTNTVYYFEKRKDQFIFKRLAKHKDPHGLILSNLVARGTSIWVGDIASIDGDEVWKDWCRRVQSLTYNFDQDMARLLETNNLESILACSKATEPPRALEAYWKKQIGPETLAILGDWNGFRNHWNFQLRKHPMYTKELDLMLKKYVAFLSFDENLVPNCINKYASPNKEALQEHT